MSLREELMALVQKSIASLADQADNLSIILSPPDDGRHGDLTTPVAFSLAKFARRAPAAIAQEIANALARHALVDKVDVVGGGHINIFLSSNVWATEIREVLARRDTYGRSARGNGEKINVEFVSANPTGPLHAGHGRGAIIGDVLANLLEAVGYDVTREYYINDLGAQIDVLAGSLYLHYEAFFAGKAATIPEGFYPGEYLREIAEAFAQQEGKKFLGQPKEVWRDPMGMFAVDMIMGEIRRDLAMLGIHHDVFTSEKSLHTSGLIDETVAELRERDLVYEGTLPKPKGGDGEGDTGKLTLFRASRFGDIPDCALRRSDGTWTYFGSDVAYHDSKFRRGFSRMIDVWGADHAGHVPRTKAAVEAVTGQDALRVILCQIVNFTRDGVPVKMSKRAGNFLTLYDILQHIDKDTLRFFMITKRPETHFNFDFEAVKEKSKDNPVFYIQYAHARCCSVLRTAHAELPSLLLEPTDLRDADFSLFGADENALIKLMADWPRQVDLAAEAYEPHRLEIFLSKLAGAFHRLWQQGREEATLRFIQPHDLPRTRALLALVQATAFVIASGLRIFGVTPVEELN